MKLLSVLLIFGAINKVYGGKSNIDIIYSRDVLARDEPTRTCCGLLPSSAPKIKTFGKDKKYGF
jgi:hypothetical protein